MEGGSRAWEGNVILALSTQLVFGRGRQKIVPGRPSFLDDYLLMQEEGSQHRQWKSLVVGGHGKQKRSQRQETL